MIPLLLHPFHEKKGAQFGGVRGSEVVQQYQSAEGEYVALTREAAWLDLSFRGRVCVLGADREKYLHGQVTNNVTGLKVGEGCHAALVTGKGKLQSDLFIYKLDEEILLDFEPGLTPQVINRLEKYIVADDVSLIDVAPHYGLLSLQGPQAREVLKRCGIVSEAPEKPLTWSSVHVESGEIYVVNHPRLKSEGFDLFIPKDGIEEVAGKLLGTWAGFEALEVARIELGIPRYGQDMTESNLAPEAGLASAISYNKGCYIGQEVIARIRTYGKVAKALRILRLPNELERLPESGEKLFKEAREAGYVTSSALSPLYGGKVALGYVRKEWNEPGSILRLGSETGPPVEVLGEAGSA